MRTSNRRHFIGCLVAGLVLALSGVPAHAAQIAPGGKCIKANTTAKISGTLYTCTKVGAALKWIDLRCDGAKLVALQSKLTEAKLLFPDEQQYREDLAKAQDWVKEEIEEGEDDETMKAKMEVARVEEMYKAGVKKARAAVSAANAAIAGCKATKG